MVNALSAWEFFAGIGLARMGLEDAGFKVVFANDFDPKKQKMHEGHWGQDPTYHLGDVFDLTATELPPAHLAWASFPCIDLSLAGNRAGLEGASSRAYWGFQKLLNDTNEADRPEVVIVENVLGMLTSHGGADLRMILQGLNRLGYVTDLLAIDAVHFVPQSRPRLFIVGMRSGLLRTAVLPPVTHVRPAAVSRFRQRHNDLDWAVLPTAALPCRVHAFSDLAERFSPDADVWWSEPEARKLLNQMSPRHAAAVEALQVQAKTTFGTVYRRVRAAGCMAEVRLDGVAGCLRTPRGGSSRQFVIEMGHGATRVRHMTAIEYARLQGASDFSIRVPFNQALFGFGDAVCVPVVAWLASQCSAVMQGSTLMDIAVA